MELAVGLRGSPAKEAALATAAASGDTAARQATIVLLAAKAPSEPVLRRVVVAPLLPLRNLRQRAAKQAQITAAVAQTDILVHRERVERILWHIKRLLRVWLPDIVLSWNLLGLPCTGMCRHGIKQPDVLY
ncbi:carbohydrate esterase family 4 protein [Colletotrichum asianum]